MAPQALKAELMMRSKHFPKDDPEAILKWLIEHTTERPAPYKELANPCRIYVKHDKTPYKNRRQLRHLGRLVQAHVIAFQAFHGRAVRPGLVLGHLCDVGTCIEVSHLKEVTQKENVARAVGLKRMGGERSGARTRPDRIPRGARQVIQDPATIAAIDAILEKIHGNESFSKPIRPFGHGSRLSVLDILDILRNAHSAPVDSLPEMWRVLGKKYRMTPHSISNIAKGKTHRNIMPEIARIKVIGSGRSKLSDEQVARIRATWAARQELHARGLKAALARWAGIALTPCVKIIAGKHRHLPPDCMGVPIPRCELDFRPCPGRGESSGFTQLTKEEVLAMVELYNTGATQKQVAERFGVKSCVVAGIMNRKTWRSVTDGIFIRAAKTSPRSKQAIPVEGP